MVFISNIKETSTIRVHHGLKYCIQSVSFPSLGLIFIFNGYLSLYRLQENRYEMYVKLLKDGVKELLTAKENDAALKKSQSSPHLNQESQPAAAKIKRNTSERKDYRPETLKVT